MTIRNLLTALVLLATITCCTQSTPREGTNYYFDANGSDSNNGLSPQTAWKSLGMINTVKLCAGDSILLNRGSKFTGLLEVEGAGRHDCRIVIDAYGSGNDPCISAPDSSLYAVLIKNSDYVTLQNIEVTNAGTERLPHRTGVKVLCQDYGVSHNIILRALNIHDVNGSLFKKAGGGSGILIENRWQETISTFDSLLIEDCIIRRCERNAIIWSAPWDRENFHPSTHTIVRRNLIEEVPGDGIVPIGCEGALVEYNLMRNCTDLLAIDDAAAGMWPWSCDNTTIQFNEVSDHKAPWDGQGFDSDFNCTGTTIQYNYSHDNDGGFTLICNAGKVDPTESIGNIGTVVQYNISINDAIRARKVHTGAYFSPTIHIGGPTKDTRIHNNILHANVKPSEITERCMVASEDWDGFADNTIFKENIFYAPQPSEFRLTKSTRNLFEGNYYLGTFSGMPNDADKRTHSDLYQSIIDKAPTGFESLAFLMKKVEIANGAAHVTVIDKEAIRSFFEKMKNENK